MFRPGLLTATAAALASGWVTAIPAIIAALFVGLALQRLVTAPGLELMAKQILQVGVAFLGVANSLGIILPALVTFLSDLARLMLVAALAGLGLRSSLRSFRNVGAVYVLLIVVETLFMLGFRVAAIGLLSPAAP